MAGGYFLPYTYSIYYLFCSVELHFSLIIWYIFYRNLFVGSPSWPGLDCNIYFRVDIALKLYDSNSKYDVWLKL